MREPVLSGEITSEGMLSVIREIEHLRTTGVLEFEHGDVRGEVELIAGQIGLEQREMPDGRDPVEALLELRGGSYRVFQRLPPLPVSKGDEMTRTGSLAVHVPADLMRYCEHVGMTGTLVLENASRSAEVVYDAGELVAIRVEGADEDDLHDVFGWEEGTFRIRALSKRPPVDPAAELEPAVVEEAAPEGEKEPPRRRDETGQQFLHSVEVALTKIVEEREKRRSPTRTSPPLPPAPKARASDSFPGLEPGPDLSTPKKRRDPTVRVIYLGVRDASDAGEGLRHVRKDITGEVALTDAAPERRSGASSKPAPAEGGAPAETTLAGTLAWVLVVFVLVVAALGLLAWLPPIE